MKLIKSWSEPFSIILGLSRRRIPASLGDHAEEAEATPLSEKVLAKIQDKNVFIGICTKSEYAIAQAALKPIIFSKRMLKTTVNDAYWKTSDWMIQEIGLAVGRKMSIILFLEEGVREPGGLYGDIEYIRFSRERPHEKFDKLLEMLTALPSKDTVAAPGETKPSATLEKKELEEPTESREPKANWTKENYDEAAAAVIIEGDQASFEKIDKAFKESPFSEGEAVPIWDARNEVYRMLFGKKGDLEKIKALSEKYPQNSSLRFYKARGYQELGEHERSASTYEEAAALTSKNETKARYLANAAVEHAYAGAKDRSLSMIEKIKKDVPRSDYQQKMILQASLEFARVEKDETLQIVLLEELIELRPGDTSKRFDLAYKHSQCDNEDMALYHYLKIPANDRDSSAWNNLGVSYGEFGSPVRAIDAFEKAADENETLAMSNLGSKLLSAGFLKEAKTLCDKALALGEYHENVPDLAKRIITAPEEESKKLDETIEKVTVKASFYRKLGAAALMPAPTDIGPKWQSPEGILDAEITDNSLTLTGRFERPSNPFSGLLSSSFGFPAPAPKMVTHRTTFVGEIRGNIVIGSVKRTKDGDSLLSEAMNSGSVLMFFNDHHSKLSVMENPQSSTPTFYTLARASNLFKV
jgi:tetratricopeptide (TPR) repeat protein